MRLIPTNEVIDLTPNRIYLPDELRRFWIDKNSLKKVRVRTWQKSIKRAVQLLAFEHECSQIDIYRIAMHLGIPYLWGLPTVRQIEQAHAYVLKYEADNEILRFFEGRFFDFQSNDTCQFTGDFPKEDTSQCEGLSDRLGLPSSVIYQMAIIYSLLHVSNVPTKPYNKIAKIYMRFRRNLEEWSIYAIKMRQECENNNHVDHKTKIPLEEVLGWE